MRAKLGLEQLLDQRVFGLDLPEQGRGAVHGPQASQAFQVEAERGARELRRRYASTG